VYRACALKIVADMRRCAKSSGGNQAPKLNRNLFEKDENIIEPVNGKSGSRVGIVLSRIRRIFSSRLQMAKQVKRRK
jgi:hypothetical protein